MAGTNLSTVVAFRATDANGDPVSGAELTLYDAGTTDVAPTYTDESLTVANVSPMVADTAGAFGAMYVPTGAYKIDITTPVGVSLPGYPVDDIEVGLAIGSVVQAWDQGLDDIAALVPTARSVIVGDGTNWDNTTYKVQSGVVDETAGALLAMTANAGPGGLLKPILLDSSDDLDALLQPGDYYWTNSVPANVPSALAGVFGILEVRENARNGVRQRLSEVSGDSNETYIRSTNTIAPVDWTSWDKMLTDVDLTQTKTVSGAWDFTGGLAVNGNSLARFTATESIPAGADTRTVNHGFASRPVWATVSIRCQTADLGYDPGDEVFGVWNGGGDAGQGLSVSADANVITVVKEGDIRIISKDTQQEQTITESNWIYVMQAME